MTTNLIILEGSDGVGKSTLAGRLRATLAGPRFPATVLHAEAPAHNDPVLEYVEPIRQHFTLYPHSTLILDRWHIGELVWPQLFGRSSIVRDSFGSIASALQQYNPRQYLLIDKENRIERVLRTRGESFHDVERALLGQELFLKIAPKLSHSPLTILNRAAVDAKRLESY